MTSRPGLRLPILAACAFVLLAALAVGGWPPIDAADLSISERFREIGNTHPTLIAWVRVATDVATTIPFLTAGVLLTLFLAVRRERRSATFTAVITAAVPTLWALMHLWLIHPRPENGFVTVAGNGFPSGHTSNATTAALTAIYLLGPRLARQASTARPTSQAIAPRPTQQATASCPSWRATAPRLSWRGAAPRLSWRGAVPRLSWRASAPSLSRRAAVPRPPRWGTALLFLAATLFALLIGVSRLILLAHWPTEVLGGWLLGLAVVPLAAHLLLDNAD